MICLLGFGAVGQTFAGGLHTCFTVLDAKFTDAGSIALRAVRRLDVAVIMSPIGNRRLASPGLLVGPRAEAFLPVTQESDFAAASFYGAAFGLATRMSTATAELQDWDHLSKMYYNIRIYPYFWM